MLIDHDCKNNENAYKSNVPKTYVFLFLSKNEYAEVVRVLQVVEDLIEAYIEVLQVCYQTWEPSFLIS